MAARKFSPASVQDCVTIVTQTKLSEQARYDVYSNKSQKQQAELCILKLLCTRIPTSGIRTLRIPWHTSSLDHGILSKKKRRSKTISN
ncbi:hypothetical protein JTE90_026789 [Oedothorax gibbosus]|uniref:Uncharacterized protein n=1 Tax=Oedothorax gibbosus TaxID=931172 RepID=A0AAV6UQ73_9ARAC|nr:hypothetical protein JTE90_026789 [Oedothorax gibbosus]